MTVADEIKRIRTSKGRTLREVAEKCDIHFTTIHKAESAPVRWETVHAILSVGLSIKPGSRPYERMKELWLGERLERQPRSHGVSSALRVATMKMDDDQLAAMQEGIEKLAAKILAKKRVRRAPK